MDRGGLPLNIPVGGGAGDGPPRNDPNRPVRVQVTELFLNTVVPAVCMGIAGYFASQYSNQKRQIEEAEKRDKEVEDFLEKKRLPRNEHALIKTIMQLEENLSSSVKKEVMNNLQKDYERSQEQVHNLNAIVSKSVGKYDMEKLLKKIEYSREKEREQLVSLIKSKHSVILDVLDIACSPFSYRSTRIPIQQSLIETVSHPGSDLACMQMTPDLMDIFEHDNLFAGSNRLENGRLWRIYARLWEERAEKMKYKKAWDDIKNFFENK